MLCALPSGSLTKKGDAHTCMHQLYCPYTGCCSFVSLSLFTLHAAPTDHSLHIYHNLLQAAAQLAGNTPPILSYHSWNCYYWCLLCSLCFDPVAGVVSMRGNTETHSTPSNTLEPHCSAMHRCHASSTMNITDVKQHKRHRHIMRKEYMQHPSCPLQHHAMSSVGVASALFSAQFDLNK